MIRSTASTPAECVERVPIYVGIDYWNFGMAYLANGGSIAVAGVGFIPPDSLALFPSGGFFVLPEQFVPPEPSSIVPVVPANALVRLRSVGQPYRTSFGVIVGGGVGWMAAFPFYEEEPAVWLSTALVGAVLGGWASRQYRVVRDCRVVSP